MRGVLPWFNPLIIDTSISIGDNNGKNSTEVAGKEERSA